MAVVLTIGLSISVFACVLSIISTALPYWIYVKSDAKTVHEGLWRNCTTYSESFDCRNVTDVAGWFHAVQALMIIGIVVLFLSTVCGCLYCKDDSRGKAGHVSAFAAILGGALLAIAVIVFGTKNKENRSNFSAGFYLTILSAVFALLAGALLAISRKRASGSRSMSGYTSIGP